MKASPLLRAWLARLQQAGAKIHYGQTWQGWRGDPLIFADGTTVKPDALLLALGGASWPKLGSDGTWVDLLKARGIAIAPLRPANCGFKVLWSPIFRTKFAGTPLKPGKVFGGVGGALINTGAGAGVGIVAGAIVLAAVMLAQKLRGAL